MAIEMQFTNDALRRLVIENATRALRQACLPPVPGAFIDHIDLVPSGAAVAQSQGATVVTVPAAIYVVTEAQLTAGAVPPANPTTTIALSIALSAKAQPGPKVMVALTAQKPALPPGFGLDPNTILPPVSNDVFPLLTSLGVTKVQTADVVQAGATVAIRIDPTEVPQARLAPGQDWGLFLGRAAIEDMVRMRIQPSLGQQQPGAHFDVAYRLDGSTPQVDVTVTGLSADLDIVDIPIPVTFHMTATLLLLPGPTPVLRIDCTWSVEVQIPDAALVALGAALSPVLGILAPSFVGKVADTVAKSLIKPEQYGATPTGDHSFVIDKVLPLTAFPPATLRPDTLVGQADGMTIGGRMLLTERSRPPFGLVPGKLGKPVRLQLCSERAKSGSGAPSHEPLTLQNTMSNASIQLEGIGILCGVEVRSPGPGFAAFVHAPTGVPLESATINVSIPYQLADAMGGTLRLLVRTPRGVRLVDLGHAPPVKLDANGTLIGGLDLYIPDCLYTTVNRRGGTGLGWGLSRDEVVDHGLDDPDFANFLASIPGLAVQTVQLSGLAPGEWLRFRSSTHRIDVTADAQGRAILPVLLPLSPAFGSARLDRAIGRRFGDVLVRTTMFQPHTTVPGELHGPIRQIGQNEAEIVTLVHGEPRRHAVSALGALPKRRRGNGETSLNPQPLPPEPPPEDLTAIARRAGLTHLATVAPVPGAHPLLVARREDGTQFLLERTGEDQARIAGTITGPIGPIATSGTWAAANLGNRAMVFRTRQTA